MHLVTQSGRSTSRIRVLRVIARMNIGGPAYHVSLLSGQLDPHRYETLLVAGHPGQGEASFSELGARYGARSAILNSLGPSIRPWSDVCALIQLARIVRTFRPDIVHTHTAKAGALGRVAARIAGGSHPVVVHTFHGHVLEGFFGRSASRFFTMAERLLARQSDCLIGVSEVVVADLVRLRVAPRSKFRVIPLGLDLGRFLALRSRDRQPFRNEIAIQDEDVLFVFSGRLVPTKRIDLMLSAFASAQEANSRLQLAIVGDGVLRDDLERMSGELGIANRVRFVGYRKDIEAIVAAADVALLSSSNEGTPLFLIEAAAAGKPAVATAVDGVADIVTSEGGVLVRPGDRDALSAAMLSLASDGDLRARLGEGARHHAMERFSSSRLLRDIDELYRELLASREHP